MSLNGIKIGDWVTIRTTKDLRQVVAIDECDGTDFPLMLNDDLWYRVDQIFPPQALKNEPLIQEAWIVEGITFTTREEAEDQVLGIKLHNELQTVFKGALRTAGQEAILETLILKLVKDKQTFKDIFNERN